MSSMLRKFNSRVIDNELTGCRVWSGPTNRKGYGVFYSKRLGVSLAHRAAWVLTHGQIPDGMLVLHRCDNPPCVNPDHLYVGTYLDNSRDCVERGRLNPYPGIAAGQAARLRNLRARTHCRRGHLVATSVVVRKTGAKYCRDCANHVRQIRRRVLGRE